MLNVRPVQAHLYNDRIKCSKYDVPTGLRLILRAVRERDGRCAGLCRIVQVQRSLQAVLRYEHLQSVLSYEKNVAFLILNFAAEK